ncbi:FRG domain protein (fragment) [Acidithiobacillus ferrivorans]|uniref:FRG domain protein n=1 Tax=Acidithiobacillus ferrivorans TaxID=160808 RepID=A0A060UWI2_9PROT
MKATYRPINGGEHEGVIYLLRFRDPAVKQTDYLVNELGVFEHLPVERPIRQRCGLPAFHGNEIAAAARDLDAVILLDANFDTSGLPDPKRLFPLTEDPFYLALLEQKKRFGAPWNWVVDYEF